MANTETDLEMVRRHVLQGKRQVAKQMAIVSRFHATNLPAGTAERLLSNFRDMQKEHEAHLQRLEAKSREVPKPKRKGGPSPWDFPDLA